MPDEPTDTAAEEPEREPWSTEGLTREETQVEGKDPEPEAAADDGGDATGELDPADIPEPETTDPAGDSPAETE